MKKISLLMIFVIFLTGCSSSNGLTDETVDLGKRALEVIDDFLNKEITAKEANEIVEKISDKLNTIIELDERDTLEKSSLLNLNSKISLLRTEFVLLYANTTRSSSKVKDIRKDIASYIK